MKSKTFLKGALFILALCTVWLLQASSSYADTETVPDTDLKGKGTEESPFLIGNKDDLEEFSFLVNDWESEDSNVCPYCAKLTNDIVLNDIHVKRLLCDPETGEYVPKIISSNGDKVKKKKIDEWFPIGYMLSNDEDEDDSAYNDDDDDDDVDDEDDEDSDDDEDGDDEEYEPHDVFYGGEFDGDGHTIRGVYINDPDENYLGLFGATYFATIENIRLVDSFINGDTYVGGIVGWSQNTLVANCEFDDKSCNYPSYVLGNACVGGITGASYDAICVLENGEAKLKTGVLNKKNIPSLLWNANHGIIYGKYCFIGGVSGLVYAGNEKENTNDGKVYYSSLGDKTTVGSVIGAKVNSDVDIPGDADENIENNSNEAAKSTDKKEELQNTKENFKQIKSGGNTTDTNSETGSKKREENEEKAGDVLNDENSGNTDNSDTNKNDSKTEAPSPTSTSNAAAPTDSNTDDSINNGDKDGNNSGKPKGNETNPSEAGSIFGNGNSTMIIIFAIIILIAGIGAFAGVKFRNKK